MNKCIFTGFISSEIKGEDITLKSGESMRKCGFNIGCSRKSRSKGADFPRVIALGKNAENIEKYFSKGQGIEVICHVQTNNYKNKEGKMVYITELIVDEFEFAKTRKSDEQAQQNDGGLEVPQQEEQPSEVPPSQPAEEFMNIPENILDDDIADLPFRK